jgi:hypothetical protein
MSEIKNLDNCFNNLDISKDEKNNDTEKEKNNEINKIIKEASDKAEWVTMEEHEINDFMENFIEFSDENNIEWEKFNYEVFGYSYYKSRFPKFSDDVIDILVKCSEKKIYNDIKDEKPPKREYTEEDFIVRFD